MKEKRGQGQGTKWQLQLPALLHENLMKTETFSQGKLSPFMGGGGKR